MRIYSIFDRKLREHLPQLVVDKTDAAVQRGLVDGLAGSPGSMMARHPEDYDVFFVGELDVVSGRVHVPDIPMFVENVGVWMGRSGVSSSAEGTDALREVIIGGN